MSDDISYEEHVQQNNQRLISIRNSLTEISSFSNACSELTQWCSDPRAFSGCFEDNLLNALQVAAENGTKENYDFGLAHQLITTCFSHRKLLSKNSATRINRWYEQFRRLKKSGGKKKKRADAQSVAAAPLPIDTQMDQITVTESGRMWNPQGMSSAQPMRSPAYPQGAGGMVPMQYAMQPGFAPMDPAGARPPTYPGGNPAMYDQNAMQMQQQRAMMMHQQQQHQFHQMQQQQQQQQATAAAAAGRNRRTVQQQMAMQQDPMYQNVPMGVNMVPGQSQPLMRVPSQPGMPSPAYPGGMGRGMMVPQQSPGYPQPNNPQMIRAGPPVIFGSMQQPAQQQQVTTYMNPGLPGYHGDNLPPISIPVQGLTVLEPFVLTHNETISNVEFVIDQQILQHLQNGADLQLRCFPNNDPMKMTVWPVKPDDNMIAVMISVNQRPVNIHSTQQSVYIKGFVQPGTNVIQFNVAQCVCSHMFAIQLVFRLTIPGYTQKLFERTLHNHTVNYFKDRITAMMPQSGMKIPLQCRTTGKRLAIPARSSQCSHASCFDLEPFLLRHIESASMMCSICQMMFQETDLVIDVFLGQIIRQLQTNRLTQNITEIFMNSSGDWTPCEPELPPVVPTKEPTKRKRKTAEENEGTGPAHPMKRIKSEQFAPAGGMSPFPTSSSVPVQNPFGQSPAAMLSPFTGHTSPMKTGSSPAAARYLNGPGTPITPGGSHPSNLSPMDMKPTMTDLHPNGTSPHHGVKIEQHGSVETPSLTGSAPYTPASLSSVPTTVTTTAEANSHLAPIESIDVNILYFQSLWTPDECNKYMQMFSISSNHNFDGVDLKDESKRQTFISESWDDIMGLISAEMRN